MIKMRYLLKSIIICVLLIAGCSDSGLNVNETEDLLLFEGDYLLPNQENFTWWNDKESENSKSKSLSSLNKNQIREIYKVIESYSNKKKSPYVAFTSKKITDKNGKDKFKYKYFKLKPNEKDIQESKGEKIFYYEIFIDPNNNEIYQILVAFIPNTEEQIASLKSWGNNLNQNGSNKSKSSNCTSEEGLTWDFDYQCFSIGIIRICEPVGPSNPEVEIPEGGNSDYDDDCQYTAGGCEEEPVGGGGGAGTEPTTNCPFGQVEDANGNCIVGEVPCEGNPLKNPRIAPQKKNSGMDGGRFTVGEEAVRNQGTKDHNGLDLLIGHGEALFVLANGNVRATGKSDKLGLYVIVSYEINNEDVWILYGHLNSIRVGNGEIDKGTVIGTAGISGNLAGAIRDQYAFQHVHIEVRIGGWNGIPINPEYYISTKFDTNGNPINETDC